jgi:hypothetical protein
MPSCFLRHISTLPYTLSYSLSVSLPSGAFQVSQPKLGIHSLFPHTYYLPNSSHLPLLHGHKISGDEYKSRTSSLCNFLQCPVISSLGLKCLPQHPFVVPYCHKEYCFNSSVPRITSVLMFSSYYIYLFLSFIFSILLFPN